MNTASDDLQKSGAPPGPLSKAPEGILVATAIAQTVATVWPGVSDPIRIVFIAVVTIGALLYGLHLANELGSQRPLTVVALGTTLAFLLLAATNVPLNTWSRLFRLEAVPHGKATYIASVHVFRDNDNDNVQGAFEKDIQGIQVLISYMDGQVSYEVGGYTDVRGTVDLSLNQPHAITVKACGVTRDNDGRQPLKLGPDNDDPALTLPVNIGVDDAHYRLCVHS